MKVKRSGVLYALLMAFMLMACDKSATQSNTEDILLQIGDSVLTKQSVLNQIPKGLTPNDSINLYNAIVKEWVRTLLLREIAEENLPYIDKINKIVEDYRNQLIVLEYRKMMADGNESQIPQDSIEKYYDIHKMDFRLTQPLVKGLFIKLPVDASRIQDVKKWVFSATPNDIEKLEKYCLTEIIQYDYFMDKWVDWSIIEEQIPYRFGKADAFIEKNKNFETIKDGSVYLWHISEYIKSGEIMPLEYASTQIRELLLESDRRKYDEELLESFCRKAIKDKRMVIGSYDSENLFK